MTIRIIVPFGLAIRALVGLIHGMNQPAAAHDAGQHGDREFVKVQGGKSAVIVTRNDYVGGGKKLLADERTHVFRVENGQRIIDVTIKFIAEHGDCVLGDKKDAGFSVRVATSMDVTEKSCA